MGSTVAEKILESHSGGGKVEPGQIVEVEIDTVVLLDVNFLPGLWTDIRKVDRPDKITVMFDHLAPAKDIRTANAHSVGRRFVEEFGITRFHDVGYHGGIVHQVVGEEAYARPGEILVCSDSHTCSGGAYNAAARGLGTLDIIQAACTGRTWFPCSPTIHYELVGEIPPWLSPKDVFLHIAGEYGQHTQRNLEFAGSVVSRWSLDERRALATMARELGAEFAIFPADDKLMRHLAEHGVDHPTPAVADPDATYEAKRVVDVSGLAPMVALPHRVIDNCVPVADVTDSPDLQQCFIGSCSNGTLDDLRVAAEIVKGRRVRQGVRFIVTPASALVAREAVRAGYVEALQDAGAIVTNTACGACAGLDLGVLGDGERAVTSSTRNFQGRMGSPSAEIFLASSATVAASALNGRLTDPRELAR
ncbi:MAG: homoaconitate hydratase family protein [Actinophytocola sp.]|uniref:3-isopropylmalate dehydratase large subunit n=1 Tax=Actinophytocola sp. TaxID=1872138 RepID=UPI00132A56F9|nr:aconitase/3-isopropylmalate dehydratase large subunit family protein [Actinophytocola sp.]MPZ80062.1 homoaconitate hydratase family protein [Actinophytocola sp.]